MNKLVPSFPRLLWRVPTQHWPASWHIPVCTLKWRGSNYPPLPLISVLSINTSCFNCQWLVLNCSRLAVEQSRGGGGCSIPLQNLPPPSLQEENRILLLSRWLSLSLLHVYEAIGQTWLFPKCSAYPKLNSENFQTLTPLPQKLPPASCLCHLAIKYFISLFLTFFSLSRSLSQGPVC